ncbi:MAG: UPF0179 family protein [Halobacteriota archaeon]|nr:UPF0179 family protein [Halobacteriota archaeon]
MVEDTNVTLIGTKLAKIGNEFIYKGSSVECDSCKLKNSCLNLFIGKRYRILGLRGGTEHDCPIHDSGVVAVEVIESPVFTAIESRRAFNGSKIFFEHIQCDNKDCNAYELCHPTGLNDGDRYTISKVIGDISDDCSKDLSLKLVELKR